MLVFIYIQGADSVMVDHGKAGPYVRTLCVLVRSVTLLLARV